MSDTQELKEALIKRDIDTVIAITGLSYEEAYLKLNYDCLYFVDLVFYFLEYYKYCYY